MSFSDKHSIVKHKPPKNGFDSWSLKVLPENMIFDHENVPLFEEMYKFKFEEGDTMVYGFPRSGTTWLQEIVWTMKHNKDLDNPKAAIDMDIRIPQIDIQFLKYAFANKEYLSALKQIYPKEKFERPLSWFDLMDSVPRPRVYKSHVPPSFFNDSLTESAKIIAIIRDPRDSLVSLWHLFQTFTFPYPFGLEHFMKCYLDGDGLFGDIANYMRQWLPYKNLNNCYTIYYEDLKTGFLPELKKLNSFLETDLTDLQLGKIKEYLDFKVMKKRSRTSADNPYLSTVFDMERYEKHGGFYRKGQIGSFKEEVSIEVQERFRNYLKTEFEGMDFPYQ